MTMCLLIFISIFLGSIQAQSQIREYNAGVHVPIHGPEEPVTWYTPGILLPDVVHGFQVLIGTDQQRAPYLGQIIAGRAEFPWIVDVANADLNEELHGIGNLVSGYWVVTVGHLFIQWAEWEQCGLSELGSYQVRFCALYLNEDWTKWGDQYVHYLSDYPVYRITNGRDASGTRIIHSMVRHPLCTRFSREYDVMMIKLNVPIDPWPPEIGYMPIWGRNYDYIPRIDPNGLDNLLCYVATYGREFYRLPRPLNLDYKTKYRVYHVPWRVCSEKKSYLCSFERGSVDLNCEFFFDQGAEDFGGRQLMCFEMRNFLGAVCNHDQGAPVVCGGVVVGFVVRGVPFTLCKSGNPFPIVVVKVDTFTGGFFSGKPLPPMTRPPTPPTPSFIPILNFTRQSSQTIDWQKYVMNNEKLNFPFGP